MVIGVCGYGYTGSGAVLDLLREYKNFSQIDADVEFLLTYYPDGLESLAYNLFEAPSRFMSHDIAIFRFEKFIRQYARSSGSLKRCTNNKLQELSKRFLSEIVDVSWKGHWMFDFYCMQDTFIGWFISRVIRQLQHYINKTNLSISIIKNRNMRLATDKEVFYSAAKQLVRDIIHEMMPSPTDRIVLNQPFAANYPSKSFAFFDDPKAIIVDRDPRDVYILAKKALKSSSAWIPTENVDDYIAYYKWMHSRFETEKDNPNVIIVRFEDLIYNLENVIPQIERVIGALGEKNGKQYFHPEISKNNTQLFKRFPEFSLDVEKIENELKEYLYCYDNQATPDFTTRMF